MPILYPSNPHRNPREEVYYPAEDVEPTYDELVVFQQAQALPIYMVTLQTGLTRSPALLDIFRTHGLLPITEAKLANPGKPLSIE